MVFEKWNSDFDILALRSHLNDFVYSLEPVYAAENFFGWSVLSSTGSYRDGWAPAYKNITAHSTLRDLEKHVNDSGLEKISKYTQPTEICHGYLKHVIDKINETGLVPTRARIIRLAKKSESLWHRDSPDAILSVRLHIPIHTNSECYFETEHDRAHMPADGSSYFVKVNRLHRVVNWGDTPRLHLVMDVKDTKGISLNHRQSLLNLEL